MSGYMHIDLYNALREIGVSEEKALASASGVLVGPSSYMHITLYDVLRELGASEETARASASNIRVSPWGPAKAGPVTPKAAA